MKNLELNEQKIKKVLRAGIVLSTAAFSVVCFSGCNKEQEQVPSDYPSEFAYVDQENNDYGRYYTTIIRDGEPVKAYHKENIAIIIDKDTFEFKEYLYVEGIVSAQIYDLETGYLICEANASTDNLSSVKKDYENLNKLLDNSYEVYFANLEAYDVGEENIKDFYTLEEIRELEPKIIESVKIILEYEKGQQFIKKTNEN